MKARFKDGRTSFGSSTLSPKPPKTLARHEYSGLGEIEVPRKSSRSELRIY
jgi:hypothetical protein